MSDQKKPIPKRLFKAIVNTAGVLALTLAIYWTATGTGLFPICRRFVVEFGGYDDRIISALGAFVFVLAAVSLPVAALVVALGNFTDGYFDDVKKNLERVGVRL
jgi:hypothetical protein